MRKITVKRIITIVLIIVMIGMQFAYASSDLTVKTEGKLLGTYKTKIMGPDDEEGTKDDSITKDFIREENKDDAEIEEPILRSDTAPYFSNVFDASDYLDSQIANYLDSGGPSNIVIYIHYGNGINKTKIGYYSHLYHAFSGYWDNFYDSIIDLDQYETINGVGYFKYIYNIESTLTRTQILQACSIASTIANQANQESTFADKIIYINDTINEIIDYHDVNHDPVPTDGCDTAYSLCTGDALCTGFTGAFCLICYEAGLNAVPISGLVKQPGDSSGGGHAWNLIKAGNKWKQVDCTFDDVLFGADTYATRGVYDLFTSAYKQNHIIDTTYNCWVNTSSGWTYIDSYGYPATESWKMNSNYWYYLEEDACMAASKWLEIGEEWYYFKANGRMAASEWAQDSTGWCYMNSSGHITRSAWIQKDGYWYYLKANGYRAENEWAQDSIGYCWMYSDGRCETGTMWFGSPLTFGSRYILSGHRVDGQTIEIDGYSCTFNGTGELIAFVEIQ